MHRDPGQDKGRARDGADEDHDLLTYRESATRLKEEIAAVERSVRDSSGTGREALEHRLVALREALERNSRRWADQPGHPGHPGHTPGGDRNQATTPGTTR